MFNVEISDALIVSAKHQAEDAIRRAARISLSKLNRFSPLNQRWSQTKLETLASGRVNCIMQKILCTFLRHTSRSKGLVLDFCRRCKRLENNHVETLTQCSVYIRPRFTCFLTWSTYNWSMRLKPWQVGGWRLCSFRHLFEVDYKSRKPLFSVMRHTRSRLHRGTLSWRPTNLTIALLTQI